MRNFKESISGKDKGEDEEDDDRPELTKATAKPEQSPAEERQVNEALGRSGD